MTRTLAIALLIGFAGCAKSDSDDDDCGGESSWTPGGAGETDPSSGSTREYSNGHSLDWLETNQDVIDGEMELIRLINSYRAYQGRGELYYDKALTRCARGHSRHTFEHGQFQGHVNPEGDDWSGRMAKNGIESSTSGENISYGAVTPQAAFDGWLNSPDHRYNMARECYTRVGVGTYGGVWTANFAR